MREIIQPIRGHDEEKHHPVMVHKRATHFQYKEKTVMVHKRATHFLYKEKTVMVQNILGKRDISKKREKGRNTCGCRAACILSKNEGPRLFSGSIL